MAEITRKELILALVGADYPKLSGVDLAGLDMRGLHLERASFIGADLSGADLRGARLKLARFQDADLSGADLTGAELTKGMPQIQFAGAKLDRVKGLEFDEGEGEE